MPAKVELKARLSLDKSLFDRGIVAAQGGARQLATGLAGIARIGTKAFAFAGAAAIGLGTGIAYGTKRAFDLGNSLKELSSRTGILPGKLLVLQRAFKDAGLEAEDIGPSINRMQRYLESAGDKGLGKFGLNLAQLKALRPDQQFEAIGKAIAGIRDPAEKTKAVMDIFGKSGGKLLDLFGDPTAMQEAAAAVGKQAAILNQNAGLFDAISDKLGHAGTKLQGFFVGIAGGLADSLLPILNKLDTLDLSGIGQKFGQSLVTGAQALVGFFSNPAALFDATTSYFRVAVLGIGNVLIAAFKSGLQFLQSGLIQVFASVGSAITATLLEAFARPLATFQAQIENVLETMLKGAHTKTPWELARVMKEGATGANIPKRTEEILKEGGARFGGGAGMTAEQWRKQAREQFNAGMDKAAAAAKGFNIEDVLGAAQAMDIARAQTAAAAQRGAGIIASATAAMPAPAAAAAMLDPNAWRFAGFNQDLAGMSAAYKTSPYAYKTHPDAYGQTGPQPGTEPAEMEQPITADQMRNIMQEAGWF
jgi:hypothetical protein